MNEKQKTFKQFGNDEIPSETKQSTALTGNQ